ncbi:MAG: hypothetical protein RLZZ338_1958 [Cyanobacteriota bacterium]|jgi:FkbM family methyltransferase
MKSVPTNDNLYQQYLQNNCPSLDEKIWLGINEILLNTSWDDPQSAKDLNNFAVIALIEAENAEDLSMREFYLDLALEALNKGVELYNDPLCAAHFALILAMTGDVTQATHITFNFFINTLDYVYVKQVEAKSLGIIYLPKGTNQLKIHQNEQLLYILQADDGYQQALLFLGEVMRRAEPFFYNERGLRMLDLNSQLFPHSISINFKLAISYMTNLKLEGLLYLHRARKLDPHSPGILQALHLAYRDLQQTQLADFWLKTARNLCQDKSSTLEWYWSQLEVNSPITYIPFENDLILTIEPSLRSYVTVVLMAEGDWFEKEMEFWRNFIKPGMTVIDVGANVGVYTFSAARRVGPEGRVLAVEPFANCVHCLEETSKLNQFNWVQICAGAASSHIGTACLSLSTASELNEIITNEQAEKMPPGSFVEVPCFTLDSLIEQENLTGVDWLKIDAEGHEMSVIEGCKRILSDFAPGILYENVASDKANNLPVADYLMNNGYKLFHYQPYIQQLLPIESVEDLDWKLNVIALPNKRERLNFSS